MRATGLGMRAQSPFAGMILEAIVVVFCDQVGDGAAQIEEEAVAGFTAGHNASSHHRQIRHRIVPSPALEFFTEAGSPICSACFPAIGDQIAQAAADIRFCRIQQRRHGIAPVVVKSFRAQRVERQSERRSRGAHQGFRRGRVGVADAQNLPRSRRKIPLHVAALVHPRTQIDDVADFSVLVAGGR